MGLGSGLLGAAWLMASPALAKRPQVVTVSVEDPEGRPIPNAWVRIPGTEGRRTVEQDTGVWEATTLFDPSGQPIIFQRGMRLELTVTAPGYAPVRVSYKVRSRRNSLDVTLVPMQRPDILPQGVTTLDTLVKEWLGAPEPDED